VVHIETSAGDEAATIVAQALCDAHAIGVEAMNAFGTGIAILDTRAYVLLANTTAEQLVRQPTMFKAPPPLPLALRHADSNHALRKAVASAFERASTALQLRDVQGRSVINAVVLPLPASSQRSYGQRPTVLLAMNELVRSQAIPDRWLSQMFGLTRAEALVANWLVSGRSIDEYAQHRGISLETARSQLKTVLSKTGMSRQAQLVAALARLPVEQAR
jgi:DNA-binding CsgD family transcriptional regulator